MKKTGEGRGERGEGRREKGEGKGGGKRGWGWSEHQVEAWSGGERR